MNETMTIEDIERAMERMRAERERVLERLRDSDARDRRPLRSGEPTPAMRLENLDRELGRLRRRKRRAEARRPDGAHSPAPSSEATPSPAPPSTAPFSGNPPPHSDQETPPNTAQAHTGRTVVNSRQTRDFRE